MKKKIYKFLSRYEILNFGGKKLPFLKMFILIQKTSLILKKNLNILKEILFLLVYLFIYNLYYAYKQFPP